MQDISVWIHLFISFSHSVSACLSLTLSFSFCLSLSHSVSDNFLPAHISLHEYDVYNLWIKKGIPSVYKFGHKFGKTPSLIEGKVWWLLSKIGLMCPNLAFQVIHS